MKIAVSSPSIAPHVRQTVIGYEHAGHLDRFYTTFFDHPDNRLARILKHTPLGRDIGRRAFNDLPISRYAARPWPELLRSFSARFGNPVLTDRIWEWAETSFDRWVAKQLRQELDAVHTYEHAALATLKRAKELGLFGVYEQPSQHHAFFNTIAREQLERYPELGNSASDLLIGPKATLRNQRRDQELALAALVLCNSTFTRNTLIAGGVDPDKIAVVPLAFPEPAALPRPERKGPLIFLHAGNQSLRKGSHLLFEAWRNCGFSADEAELWLIGKMILPEQLRRELPGKVVMRENIPHEELMKCYRQADVLLLPTLADGFGMVVTEAMSQGVAAITSYNCCGPDVIDPGKDGWLVQTGDADALAQQMRWCVAHAADTAAAGAAAREKAATYQWTHYQQKLNDTITEACQRYQNAKRSV